LRINPGIFLQGLRKITEKQWGYLVPEQTVDTKPS
jgi:hypothetical protein